MEADPGAWRTVDRIANQRHDGLTLRCAKGNAMELISVIVAGAAAYAFGAFWYMKWAKQWIAASGIAVDPDGKPANKSAAPFVIAGIAMLIAPPDPEPPSGQAR